LASTRGEAGTITDPVPVAASTSRRHRLRCWTANCWASPPPQEKPSTSTAPGRPSAVSMPATTGAKVIIV
jgi:hypothetical protein